MYRCNWRICRILVHVSLTKLVYKKTHLIVSKNNVLFVLVSIELFQGVADPTKTVLMK